jgi:hypothetical protein
MEYLVILDVDSPIGMFLLSLKGKVGGATDVMALPNRVHPYIIARDLDWSKLPAFVRMTHLRNPGAEDPQPRELVVPAQAVLGVVPHEPPKPGGQEKTGSLH